MATFKKFVYNICGIVVIVCIVLLTMYYDAQKVSDIEPVYGEPKIYVEKLNFNRMRIDQICHDEQHFYLLDESKGRVRVFNTNGDYEYTIALFDYLNGVFRLAIARERLYICDPHQEVYAFQNGEFAQFFNKENAVKLLQTLDFEKNSEKYLVRNGSVWEISNGEEKCVLDRPLYAARYVECIVFAVLIILCVIMRFKYGKMK